MKQHKVLSPVIERVIKIEGNHLKMNRTFESDNCTKIPVKSRIEIVKIVQYIEGNHERLYKNSHNKREPRAGGG